jgi:iron complex outermembrane receptor protein
LKKILSLTSCTLAIIVAGTGVACAEENDNKNKDGEIVIVTAQKRKQDLQKTPIAITALSGDDLAKNGKTTISDALNSAPGVQIQGIAQGGQVFIRGVGSAIDPAFADSSVALMEDGVYNGRSETIDGGGFDIERVEVLRGPQGTLYGRNATGGAINIITKSPTLGETEGYLRVGAGNYKYGRFEGGINLPLGDKVAIRASGVIEQHDPYISNGGLDENYRGLRVKALFQPNDDIKIVAKYDYSLSTGDGQNTVPVAGSAGKLNFPPIFGIPSIRPDGWVTSDPSDPWSNDPDHPAGVSRRVSTIYSIDASWNLGFATLNVLPSYTKMRSYMISSLLFGSLSPSQSQNINTTYKSIEARLSSNSDSKIAWMLGVFYLDSYTPNPLYGYSDGYNATGDGYYSLQTFEPNETKAVFGQATYPFTDKLRGTVGLRYSEDSQGSSYQITGLGSIVYDSGVQSATLKQGSNTFKVGFEYDLAPKSMLYGYVASGFKQGGVNAKIPLTTFKPEKLMDYEIGIKNRLFDDKLTLNASVFLYDYEDYQVFAFLSSSLGSTGDTSTGGVILNAGKTQFKGLELQAVWRPNDKDTFRASMNLLDTKYGTLILPDNPFEPLGSTYDATGKQAANAPKWVFNLGYAHTFELPYAFIDVGVDSKISAEYYATPEAYLAGALQESYTRTDANIRYTPKEDSHWDVSAYVKNIENEAQTLYVWPGRRRLINAPRTFGVMVNYKF